MHLIVFCHLRWDFVLQRPQHVLSRLAAHYPIVFVEEPVRCDGEPSLEVSSPSPNVEVLRPRTACGGSGFEKDQVAQIADMLASHLQRRDITQYAVWLYTPMALPLLDGLHPAATLYDCMDELSAFKGASVRLRDLEKTLLEVCDVVFTGGPSLYDAKRDRHPNVLCLPSAVDAKHYSRARALSDNEGVRRARELQSGVGSPRLGFFGVIDERLDLELLARLADADPEWHLVMVGPVVKVSPDALPMRPNIHWLGQQSYDLLPQLVASWDVCLLPFALNESTRFISPTKTLEYMAAGKPVVSTAVRDVSVLYGKHVRIADDADQFISACRAALEETPAQVHARTNAMLETVARYSWDNTAEAMRAQIDRLLLVRSGHELYSGA